MKSIGGFSRNERILLDRFLSSTKRPEGTMTYPQLAGFLFAVCCAPELVRPSEWMPLIFNEHNADYRDIDEVNEVLQALMALYNWINRGVQEREPALPPGCAVLDEAIANLDPAADLSQWARGFADGFDWLELLWEDRVPDALDEELGAILMILSFFASRELAQVYTDESTSENKSLEDMAVSLLDLLPDAMAGYAHLGRSIEEAVREHENTAPGSPATAVKIGRNEPCPYGSGLKYKKCCGAKLH